MRTPEHLETRYAHIVKEWVITVQAPVIGSDVFLDAVRDNIELIQGNYACCLHLSGEGHQQFRALEGSHAGAETTIQSVPVVDISMSIPAQEALLQNALDVIFEHHVHEDPTIRIAECWATRSKYVDMKDNPNKYWNRDDADKLHGASIKDLST